VVQVAGSVGARVEYPAAGPIRIVGEIDLASADSVLAALSDGLAAANGSLRLDFSEVSFLDSSGIRMLLGILRARPGLRLDLAPVSPPVERVLSISGFPPSEGVIYIGPLDDAV
jgi:anti-anti-sigma factor